VIAALSTARGALGERYRHIFVDEFQDTDPFQAEIQRMIIGRNSFPRGPVEGQLAS